MSPALTNEGLEREARILSSIVCYLLSLKLQGRYKMTMGLEPMNPLDWIEIDEDYEREMALRKDLITNNRSIVIHSLPGVRHPSLLVRLLRCLEVLSFASYGMTGCLVYKSLVHARRLLHHDLAS